MRHLLTRRFLFFGGKGGVGKTTCSAATALAAGRAGRRVLLVSTDPAHSLSDAFGCQIGAEEREVAAGLRVLELDAETEMHRYLEEAKSHLSSAFGGAVLNAALRQIELTATMPGVADVAIFDRMCDILLSRREDRELIIFDTAPTGHTLRLLAMPESMGVWVRALADRRREAHVARETATSASKAEQDASADPVLAALDRRAARLDTVLRRLTSDEAAVVLVLVPERLPIEETARAVRLLKKSGIQVGGLVVNRVLPDDLTGEFYRARKAQERRYLDEIADRFPGVPRTCVPQLASDVRGRQDLDEIARHLGISQAAETGVRGSTGLP